MSADHNRKSRLQRYRTMLRIRAFEEACLEGLPTREIHGELHTAIGQEAIAAGMVEHLRTEDAMVSTHRNHAHGLAKGVDPHAYLAEIYERETGLCRGRGGHMHPFDPGVNFSATGIVGAGLPVAAGYAYGFKLEGRDAIAVAPIGDGAINTGGFHEAMNMAGAWKLPLVVLIENNRVAISVEIEKVSATATLAERAAAYGAWGRKIDGTDVDVVADAFGEAAAHARGGYGPAILEATCFRFQGHYEGDPDTYRTREERKRMRAENDPIVLYRAKLTGEGVANGPELGAIEDEEREMMRTILERVRGEPMPDVDTPLAYGFVEGRVR